MRELEIKTEDGSDRASGPELEKRPPRYRHSAPSLVFTVSTLHTPCRERVKRHLAPHLEAGSGAPHHFGDDGCILAKVEDSVVTHDKTIFGRATAPGPRVACAARVVPVDESTATRGSPHQLG